MCECIQFFKAIFDCKKCIQCDIVIQRHLIKIVLIWIIMIKIDYTKLECK